MLTSIRISKEKGRGIFANKKIRSGTVIEVCPILILPRNDWKYLEKTLLSHYVFNWAGGSKALALGNGSLYNHSKKPNCKAIWVKIKKNTYCFEYTASRSIRKGEEICIDYGYRPNGYSEKLDSGL